MASRFSYLPKSSATVHKNSRVYRDQALNISTAWLSLKINMSFQCFQRPQFGMRYCDHQTLSYEEYNQKSSHGLSITANSRTVLIFILSGFIFILLLSWTVFWRYASILRCSISSKVRFPLLTLRSGPYIESFGSAESYSFFSFLTTTKPINLNLVPFV